MNTGAMAYFAISSLRRSGPGNGSNGNEPGFFSKRRKRVSAQKLAKKENKKRTDALYERIQDGSCKVIEHNGKKYACEVAHENYVENYTIYPEQKDGKFNADEYTCLSADCSINGAKDIGYYQDFEHCIGFSTKLENQEGKIKIQGQEMWNEENLWILSETISMKMKKHHKVSDEFLLNPLDENYEPKTELKYGISEASKSIGFTEVKLPVDETTLPKKVAEYYGRIPESSQSSESLLKDRSSALVEFYKKLENSPSKDLFEIISRGCPEGFCAQAYAQYKEQVNAQERQSRITETKQRLSENKDKTREQPVEEQQQTNSVVQEVSNVETLAKQKAIKDRLQKE